MKKSLRFLLPLAFAAALPCLTSCQLSNHSPMPETNNHGKPGPSGMGNMQEMDHGKMRM